MQAKIPSCLTIVLMALLCSPASAARDAAALAARVDAAFAVCADGYAQSGRGADWYYSGCFRESSALWDADIERLNARLARQLPAACAAVLLQAQTGWSNLRKRDLEAYRAIGHERSGYQQFVAEFELALATQRHAFLTSLIEERDGIPPRRACPGVDGYLHGARSAAVTRERDAQLNAAYTALRSRLQGVCATHLLDAQRAWLRSRDLDIAAYGAIARLDGDRASLLSDFDAGLLAERVAFLDTLRDVNISAATRDTLTDCLSAQGGINLIR